MFKRSTSLLDIPRTDQYKNWCKTTRSFKIRVLFYTSEGKLSISLGRAFSLKVLSMNKWYYEKVSKCMFGLLVWVLAIRCMDHADTFM